jgi:hypothetical protein
MKTMYTSSALAPEKCLQTRSRLGGLKLFSVLILASLFSLLSSGFVHAQEAVSLVVSPPRTDVVGNPGEIVQKNIKITNNSDTQELILQVHVQDFIVQDDLGTPIPVSTKLAGRYLASPWFTLEKTEIVIPAKSTIQIVVLVTIPSDALPGGHYAGVFFKPVPSRGMKSTVSYTSAQVGSLFAINVPGDIKYDALIKEFSTKLNVFEFGPIDFTAVLENQSDTHISPKSNITVKDMVGRTVADIPVADVNIFPYTSRTIQARWDTVWGVGRYSATINANYGPGMLASRTMYFWILPYRLIATIGVVILVLIAIYITIRRHMIHRLDRRDDEIENLKRKIAEMENKSN